VLDLGGYVVVYYRLGSFTVLHVFFAICFNCNVSNLNPFACVTERNAINNMVRIIWRALLSLSVCSVLSFQFNMEIMWRTSILNQRVISSAADT